ncbi:MAG: IS200/IS605 family transposase [Balneolaceae bacterium]
MANTYHQLYIQTVFPVKYRKALINPIWEPKLLAVVGNLINETGCNTFIVNGVEDHIHCFFGLKPSLSVSEVMKTVKGKSSKWINESGFLPHRFEWQPGYGCFSYSRSHIDAVYQYIKGQKKHHRRLSFREEYINMLEKFGIKYDERYLFKELK